MRYDEVSYDIEAFPRIAADTFVQLRLHERLQSDELFDWIFDAAPRPDLPSHGGSQIIVLHTNRWFDVCAHLWSDGYVTAHHHAWAGAYQVLQGTGIHVAYAFEHAKVLDEGLSRGELSVHCAEPMAPGFSLPVEPGPSLIHGFSYGPGGGLTVSVRSKGVARTQTVEYFRSGLAVETHAPTPWQTTQFKALRFLFATDRPQFRERLACQVRTGGLPESFGLLRHACELGASDEDLTQAIEAGRRAHPEMFAAIVGAMADIEAESRLARVRAAAVAGPGARLAAALGLGLDREAAQRLCGIETSELGRCAAEVLAAEGHAVTDDRFADGVLPILDLHLRHPTVEGTVRALAADYALDGAAAQEMVRATCSRLRAHPVIGRLW